MFKDLAGELSETVLREFAELVKIDEAASMTGVYGTWSRRQELGHLIDSAANNHMRAMRAAIDGKYEGPGYAQDEWVKAHAYGEMQWADLVTLWKAYNGLFAHAVARISEERAAAPCIINGAEAITLEFMVDDYILHMRYHLDRILGREKVTAYPRR